MHEESLMRTVINQAEAIADKHGGSALEAITVEIGPLSGVEPQLMQSAFERLVAETRHAQARLKLNVVPLSISCEQCGQQSELVEIRFECPHCEARDVHINAGDNIILSEVVATVEQAPACEAVQTECGRE